MGTLKDSEKTRAKLIEAAGPLFSERGFKGVTVRDIAREANVPLSAINYHFRTKEVLYRDVLLEACKDVSISPEDQETLLRLEPHEALYALISESIALYRSEVASGWQSAVIARECWEPSNVFDDVVREHLKPQTDFMSMLVGRIVHKSADDPQVRFAVVSLIGLLDTFGSYGKYIRAVAPGLKDYLGKRDMLARQLYYMIIEQAGVSTSQLTSPVSPAPGGENS